MSFAYAPRHVIYNSPSNTIHVIVHNLNAPAPVISIFEAVTNNFIVTESVVIDSPNQITITLIAPRAITGRITE